MLENDIANYKNDFKTFAKDILTFEIDNRPVRYDRGEAITRETFWKDIYITRENERDQFDSFVRSDTNLLFVTGRVGAGKSTFIRHKLEHQNNYSGLILDMRSKNSKLDEKGITLTTAFKNILKDSYLDVLKDNFRLSILFNNGEYNNYTFNLPANYTRLPKDKFKNPSIDSQIRKKIAIHSLWFLVEFKEVANFATHLLGDLDWNKINKADYINLCEQRLTDQKVNELINLLEWNYLIRLFQMLEENPGPHLIVFDNLDRQYYKKLDRYYLEEILELISIMNRGKDVNASQFSEPIIKVILAIRDENLSRINIAAAGSKKVSRITPDNYGLEQLIIGSRAYTFPDIQNHSVELTVELAKTIIKARLNYLVNQYKDVEIPALDFIKTLIENYWLIDDEDINTQALDSRSSHFKEFKIFELCNGSLRIMLDMIADFSFELLFSLEKNKVSIHDFKKYASIPFFRSRLIRTIWNQNKNENIINLLVSSTTDELNNELCCNYRMVLIYLFNCKEYRQNVKLLINNMRLILPVDSTFLKMVLYNLYSTKGSVGELIIIDQSEFVSDSSLILDSAIVRLTLKGEAFLRSIMLNLEFFNIASNRNEDEIPIIFELMPDDALPVIERIYNMIKCLADVHLNVWKHKFIPKLKPTYEHSSFEYYKKHHTFNGYFHIVRVCTSHMSYLMTYLKECVKRPEACRLILSDENRRKMGQFTNQNLLNNLNKLSEERSDIIIVKTLSSYAEGMTENSPLRKIIGRLIDYRKIVINVTTETNSQDIIR
jgi:hypothetical protein